MRPAEELMALEPQERRAEMRKLGVPELRAIATLWRLWAHDGQLPPQESWHGWLIMAGRGFGKTRAGAEWVRAVAERDREARIALVGATLGEARRVMVEGASGLLAIAEPEWRPVFEPSRQRLTWPNGAEATLFSAGEPESLRGPQHSHASGSISERSLRQRGFRASRRTAPAGGAGRARRPTGGARAWRLLSSRRGRERSLGGSRPRPRGLGGEPVGLPSASRGRAHIRSGERLAGAVHCCGRVATDPRARLTDGRDDAGQRGARGDW